MGILLVLVSSPQINEREFQKGLTLEKSFPLCNRLIFQDFLENPEKRIFPHLYIPLTASSQPPASNPLNTLSAHLAVCIAVL